MAWPKVCRTSLVVFRQWLRVRPISWPYNLFLTALNRLPLLCLQSKVLTLAAVVCCKLLSPCVYQRHLVNMHTLQRPEGCHRHPTSYAFYQSIFAYVTESERKQAKRMNSLLTTKRCSTRLRHQSQIREVHWAEQDSRLRVMVSGAVTRFQVS